MSYQIPSSSLNLQDDDGSSSGGEEDRLSDWASSLGEALQTKSLFSDRTFPNPEAALASDFKEHGFDLKAESQRKNLDLYGKMRLINWIRREGASVEQAKALSGQEELFTDEKLLIPVIPDDPLLQLDFDDEWSDDDMSPSHAQLKAPVQGASSSNTPDSRSRQLEAELEKAKSDVKRLQTLVQEMTFDADENAEAVGDKEKIVLGPGVKSAPGTKGKGKAVRDDDTHYFDSYEHNDIHEIMLRDTTRTVTYARFLLSNPKVFEGATVMDVGCGTGILSMFAAKAGAKHVYAIEASGLAAKARENITKNGFKDVITVIQGKVEDIELPVKHVDVIVSEWMGYMLLYESMLDSVLTARDRFLAPGGLMAPSQTRLVLTAITGEKLWKERVDFWNSVYGFDMSTMNSSYFGEGLIDVNNAKEIVTNEYIIKDVDAQTATVKSLDFRTPFELTITETTSIRAFLTHFDTFFSRDGRPTDREVDIAQFKDDEYEQSVSPVDSDISFTTGPRGQATHWKQVAFLIPSPIRVEKGDIIKGTFSCRKSKENSRELDVEIHYQIIGHGQPETEGMASVGIYRVR